MIRTLPASVVFALWLALRVQATDFTVDNLGDIADSVIGDGVCGTGSGGCTLRAAIQESNSKPATTDIIMVPAGTITLSLTGAEDFSAAGDLNPRKNMTIQGAGADKTFIVQAVANQSVFRFPNTIAAIVEIDGVTISGGSGPNGGGIFLDSGAGGLTMNDCTVSGNSTPGLGGGIANVRTLILNRCAIIGNISNGDGGGIYNGASLDATNCTFNNNAAHNNGGAILNVGSISLKSCTVAGNTCDSGNKNTGDGGGIFNNPTFMINIQNTVIAGNMDPSMQAPDYAGVFNSLGNNLVQNTTGVTMFMGITASNIVGKDPLLGPLANNGGPTRTLALLKGSPAIDAGDCTGLTTDQRGMGFPRMLGAACDIGAFEFQPTFQLTTSVVNGHGSVSPASGSQNANAVVTLTATPDAGFAVKAWQGTDNDASTSTSNQVTMSADKTVKVEFAPTAFQLTTAVVNGHGSISPSSGPQTANAVVTLTATPDAGFAVKAWQGTDHDASTSTSNQVTMSADKAVTVEFAPTAFQLTTAVVNGHGSITPSSGPQTANAVVTLAATPDPGFAVMAWQGTDNDASTDTTNQVTMSADKSVTVEFEATGGGATTPPSCGAGTCGSGGAATMLPTFLCLGAMRRRSLRQRSSRCV